MKKHKRFLSFRGFFELQNVSKEYKTIHRLILISCRALSLYAGWVLHVLSLLNATSLDEISLILSVGATYLNGAVKDSIFALRRNDIENLWLQFGGDDFKAKGPEELRYDKRHTMASN